MRREKRGDEKLFQQRKQVFYSTLDLTHGSWTTKWRETEVGFCRFCASLDYERKKRADASGLHTFLFHLCKDGSATRISARRAYSFFEACRLLCKAPLARPSTTAHQSLMNAKLPSTDCQRSLQIRTTSFRKKRPESLPRTVNQDNNAAPEFHTYLVMNQSRLSQRDAIRVDIERHMATEVETDQVTDTSGANIASIRPQSRRSRRKSSHQDLIRNPSRRRFFLMDGNCIGKRKGQNSIGFPSRSDARRFGSKCNWSWRLGDEEQQWCSRKHIMNGTRSNIQPTESTRDWLQGHPTPLGKRHAASAEANQDMARKLCPL